MNLNEEKEMRYEKEEKIVLMMKYMESVDEHNEKRKVWDLWINYEVMLVIISSYVFVRLWVFSFFEFILFVLFEPIS